MEVAGPWVLLLLWLQWWRMSHWECEQTALSPSLALSPLLAPPGECYSGDENVGNGATCPFGSYRDPRQPHSCRPCPCGPGQGCSMGPGGEEIICDHCPPGAAGNSLLASALPFQTGVLGVGRSTPSSQPSLPVTLPLLPAWGV